MKNLITIVLFAISIVTFGQNEDAESRQEIKTLFSKGTKVTGYGAFDMMFTNMNNSNTLLLGGHGAVIFNKSFLLGFSGMGISAGSEFTGIDPQEQLRLSGGYGGLMLGYILAPTEIFHITFPVTLGMGAMDVVNSDYRFGSIPQVDPFSMHNVIESSLFLMIEPGAQVEINISKFFRLGVGASYRFTDGLQLSKNNIGDKEISGFNGNLSFKFGFF